METGVPSKAFRVDGVKRAPNKPDGSAKSREEQIDHGTTHKSV